jgi:hypothetical protein
MAGRERIGKAKLPPTDFRTDLCHDARDEKQYWNTVMNRQSDEYDKPPTNAEARDRAAELAMQEYQEERLAMADKTARLRALRLARDASAGMPKPKG